MASRIVVLGSANVDLVVRQPRRAEPGETMFGTSFQTGPVSAVATRMPRTSR